MRHSIFAQQKCCKPRYILLYSTEYTQKKSAGHLTVCLGECHVYLHIRSFVVYVLSFWTTLLDTDIAPENWWLEDDFRFGMAYSQGLLLIVSGRVYATHWAQGWWKGGCESPSMTMLTWSFMLQSCILQQKGWPLVGNEGMHPHNL